MFKVSSETFVSAPVLTRPTSESILLDGSLEYFDREGYELAPLEEILYRNELVPISNVLHHVSPGQSWISGGEGPVVLDHSSLFTRYEYAGELREQLLQYRKVRHELNKLLSIRKKFGLDVSIDFIDENVFIELFHVEKDFLERERALETKAEIEQIVHKTDWQDFARYLVTHKEEWINLCSDDESDYKVRLLGLNRAFENLKVYHGST